MVCNRHVATNLNREGQYPTESQHFNILMSVV